MLLSLFRATSAWRFVSGFGEWRNDRDASCELRKRARIIERDHKRVFATRGYFRMSRRDQVVRDGRIHVVRGVRNQMREANPIQDAFRRFEDTDPHGLKERILQSGLRNSVVKQNVDVLRKSPQRPRAFLTARSIRVASVTRGEMAELTRRCKIVSWSS